MPVSELQRALLENSSVVDVECRSATSKSSFNLLDAIKRSSHRLHYEVKHRTPVDPSEHGATDSVDSLKGPRATFATITESLSASSAEMAGSISSGLSIFKSSSNRSESHDEGRHDESTEALEEVEIRSWAPEIDPQAYGLKPIETPDRCGESTPMSTAERTDLLLDRLAEDDDEDSSSSSPLHSPESQSTDDSESWGSAGGSREISLLDQIESRDDEGQTDTDGETAEDETLSDEDSPRSDASSFQNFPETDGLTALGSAIYSLGSCNFQDLANGVDFDDDYTVGSDAFDSVISHGDADKVKRQQGHPPVLQSVNSNTGIVTPPQKKSTFLQTLFGGCTG